MFFICTSSHVESHPSASRLVVVKERDVSLHVSYPVFSIMFSAIAMGVRRNAASIRETTMCGKVFMCLQYSVGNRVGTIFLYLRVGRRLYLFFVSSRVGEFVIRCGSTLLSLKRVRCVVSGERRVAN